MIRFKIAKQDWEFQEIHKLNYKTFVQEIPQHKTDSSGQLVDKFHDENTYIIGIKKGYLVGMLAVRDKRPFSLDNKLSNLYDYLPKARALCELRLLAIRKKYRKGKVLQGLLRYLDSYCKSKKYDLAIISANTIEVRLYKRLGFREFGPVVGTTRATFQPMYITYNSLKEFKRRTMILKDKSKVLSGKYFFQPGPVHISSEVREEFVKPPISHRSEVFEKDIRRVKKKLSQLVNCTFTQILMGSGTLANDAVAAHLSLLPRKGVILSNGEFGDRLINHAERFSLDFVTCTTKWGDQLSDEKISEVLETGDFEWMWFVHCETSTGSLSNLEKIVDLCTKNSVKVCVDCISSLGTVPLDLSKVHMATGVSGKGLASYSGLSFVFHNSSIISNIKKLPRYLDLETYFLTLGVPYTLSSNLLYALNRSLDMTDVESNFIRSEKCSTFIRDRLKEINLEVLGGKEYCSPAIVTFKVPEKLDSLGLGKKLESLGIHLSYRSSYLAERNLMQFALMGEYSKTYLEISLSRIEELIGELP